MSTDEVDVIHEGVIEIGTTPTSTSPKDWKLRLVVLKRQPGSKRASLDYYKDIRKRWQKQTPKGMISLWPWFQVSIAHNCSYKYPLKVTTAEHTLYMAASTLVIMNKWIYYIQTQRLLDPPKRGLNVFSVQAQDSEATNVIGARGDCQLAVSSELEIICALFPSKQIVGVWPFDSLRRYWCGDGIFGFEAGRRSPRGEGTYTFITRLDEDIYQTVANLINKKKRRPSDTSFGSADSKDVDNRPPAPLPADADRSDTPPVESSESDEDPAEWTNPYPPLGGDSNDMIVNKALGYDSIEIPPLPPKPKSLRHEANPSSKKTKLKSTASLKQAPEVSDISGTNPPYLKRSRTHTGSSPKWIHESYNPRNGNRPSSGIFAGRDLPPPPVTLTGGNVHTRDPLKEDTYSHTVHTFPAPFQRPNIVGGSLYNALVHKHNPEVPRKERPHSEADTTLYDVAFPPSRTTKTATLPVQRSDYGTINVKDSKGASNIPRTKTPLTKMPLSKSEGLVLAKPLEPIKDEAESPTEIPPLASRELHALERSQSDEGLTVNPLYGSQDNLLAEIAELDAQDAAMLDKSKEVVNPVYGDSKSVCLEEPLRGNHEERATEGWEATDQPDAVLLKVNDSDSSQQGSQHGSNSQPNSDTGGPTSPIQRDAKGYSQVDKTKKAKTLIVATRGNGSKEESEDQAPPVPERLYSYDGEVVTDV